MKKLIFSVLGIVGMLCSTSCSDESIVQDVKGDQTVQFTVELNDGSDASRAISDGQTVDRVYYEVYTSASGKPVSLGELKGDKALEAGTTATGGNKYATIQMALVKGQTYDIVFWAQSGDAYNTENLSAITIPATTANNEKKDAFTAVKNVTVNGPIKETIKLTRPFAQVNFGTLDVEKAKAAGITFSESQIVVSNAATSYNALTKQAGEGGEVTFGWASNVDNIANENLVVNGENYKYLATAYVLVPGGDTQQLSDLTMEIKTGLNENITLNVPNAPVQRNYRTNVLGNLLTNQAEFTVVVDPIYNEPDYNPISAWDGTTVTEPAVVDGAYVITSAAEFAWLAGKSIDKNIELKTNVDMSGNKFVSMAVKLNAEVVFNGNNNAISNIVVANGNNESGFGEAAGLFASTPNHGSSGTALTVKDLTVSEMTINNPGRWVGAIIGYAQSNNDVIENVTVKNSVIKGGTPDNGSSFGGLVGYVQNNCTLTISNSKVVDTYVEAAEKAAGSLIGTSSGKVTISNTSVENVDVVAPTMQGGYIGRLATGSVELTGCEGDVLYGAWLGGTLTVNEAPVTKEVSDFASLKTAVDAANAGDMILLGDGIYTGCLGVNKDVTLRAVNAKKAVYDGKIYAYNEATVTLQDLYLKNETSVTGTFAGRQPHATALLSEYQGDFVAENCTFDLYNSYAMFAKSSDGNNYHKFDNCVFNCNGFRPIQCKTNVSITNCTFNDQYRYSVQLYGHGKDVDYRSEVIFTNNTIVDPCKTSGEKNASAISVSGSYEFKNIDIKVAGNTDGLLYVCDYVDNVINYWNTCTVEGAEFVTFVDPDEENVSKPMNGGTYKVYSSEGFKYAIGNLLAADKTEIELAEGEYVIDGLTGWKGEVSISGASKEGSVLKMNKNAVYPANTKLNIKNLTLEFAHLDFNQEQTYSAMYRTNGLNIEDCNIKGCLTLCGYGKTNIKNCAFVNTFGSGFNGYGIFYNGYSGSVVNVENCTFDMVSKAIVIYNHSYAAKSVKCTLNVENCVFNASKTDDKAAIQMHTETGSIYGTVNIKNSSATGFYNVNNGLWNELKNDGTGTVTDNFDIYVDGTQVH